MNDTAMHRSVGSFVIRTRLSSLIPRSAAVIAGLFFVCLFFVDRPVAYYMSRFDKNDLRTINQITEFGEATPYIIGFIACGVLAVICKWLRLGSILLVGAGSVIASGLLVNIVKVFFGRWRPKLLITDAEWGFTFFAGRWERHGFPSGHSSTVGAVVMTLILLWPRLFPLWIAMGLLVGSTRVCLNVHYVSDVIVGLYIGGLMTIVLYKLADHLNWLKGDSPTLSAIDVPSN